MENEKKNEIPVTPETEEVVSETTSSTPETPETPEVPATEETPMAEEAPAAKDDFADMDLSAPEPQEAPKKSGMGKIIAGAVVAVGIIAAIGVGFMMKGGKAPAPAAAAGEEKYVLSAYVDEEGKAFFVKEKGEVVELDTEDVTEGYMTRDRKHMVVREKENTVKIFNAQGEKIAEQSDSKISYYLDSTFVSDSAIVFTGTTEANVDTIKKRIFDDYRKENGTGSLTQSYFDQYYSERYEDTVEDAKECYEVNLYKEYDEVYPPEGTVYYCDLATAEIKEFALEGEADGKLSKSGALYYADAKGIFKYTAGAEEPEKIQSVKNDRIIVENVYDDDYVIWADMSYGDEEKTIYGYKGEEPVKFETSDADTYVIRLAATDKFVCVPSRAESLFTVDLATGDSDKINLKDKIGSSLNVYDRQGVILNGQSKETDGIYLLLGSDYDFYYVDLTTQEREKVISDISIMRMKDGALFYLKDDTLRVAEVQGAEIGESEKISSDAFQYSFAMGVNGKDSAFYVKDVNDDWDESTLCYWNGSDSEKIATGVYPSLTQMNKEGVILYFADYEEIKNGAGNYYTAYIYKDGEATKISNDITSWNYFDDGQHFNNILFLKYNYVDDEDNVYVDVLYYDGKETTKVLSEVRRP